MLMATMKMSQGNEFIEKCFHFWFENVMIKLSLWLRTEMGEILIGIQITSAALLQHTWTESNGSRADLQTSDGNYSEREPSSSTIMLLNEPIELVSNGAIEMR